MVCAVITEVIIIICLILVALDPFYKQGLTNWGRTKTGAIFQTTF